MLRFAGAAEPVGEALRCKTTGKRVVARGLWVEIVALALLAMPGGVVVLYRGCEPSPNSTGR